MCIRDICNCTRIPVTSTRQCESFIRQSKNVEGLLEEYLQMKVKRLSNLDDLKNVSHFASTLQPYALAYLEPYKTSKMESFARIVMEKKLYSR